MSDPSRWQVNQEAARNLQRVRQLQRAMKEFGILAALILAFLIVGVIWA